MFINLNTFKHLLPRSRAWQIIVEKQLRQFFVGLVDAPQDVQDYQDGVWADYRPADTTKLDEWDDQFGLLQADITEAERRERLAAAWMALGGQDPRYLQDVVQAAGFPLFIHEWWYPQAEPVAIPRRPINYLDDGTEPDTIRGPLLGGPPIMGAGSPVMGSSKNFGPTKPTYIMGNPKAIMGGVVMGSRHRLGELIDDNLTSGIISDDPSDWPYFLYWGAEQFPFTVDIPKERETELKTLLLKLCPAQQRIGLLVNFE